MGKIRCKNNGNEKKAQVLDFHVGKVAMERNTNMTEGELVGPLVLLAFPKVVEVV